MSNKLIKELKKCPFCGGRAMTTMGVMGRITMVVCANYKECGATVSFDCSEANEQGEKATIKRWNRRA